MWWRRVGDLNNDCPRKNVCVRGEATGGEEGTFKRWWYGGALGLKPQLRQCCISQAHTFIVEILVSAEDGLCLYRVWEHVVRQCSHIKYHHRNQKRIFVKSPLCSNNVFVVAVSALVWVCVLLKGYLKSWMAAILSRHYLQTLPIICKSLLLLIV